jgi:hypothetical protein
MSRLHSTVAGIAVASFAAGPVFTVAGTLAALYLRLPQPVMVSADELMPWLAALFSSVVMGGIVAFVPNVIGSAIMAGLSKTSATARAPEAWLAAGAAGGAGIALGFGLDYSPALFFATVATATVCAGLCRSLAVLD